jgi:uncharacterized metal-binding protein YceD (DUF177 family)
MSTPEFSRPVAIEGLIPDKARHEVIEATPEECAALAKRFDLRELSGFRARVNIRRIPGGTTVRVDGDFEAEVVQACVVSLLDVPSEIRASFDSYFTEDDVPEDEELDFDSDSAAEFPEKIEGGVIDLGELVAQYLSLELPPYPRAPGVSLAAQAQTAGLGVDAGNSPFRVLEEIKKKGKGDKGKK